MAIGRGPAWRLASTANAGLYSYSAVVTGGVAVGDLIVATVSVRGGTVEHANSVSMRQTAKATTNLTRIATGSDGRSSIWAGFAADTYTATPIVECGFPNTDHTGCHGAAWGITGAYVSGTIAQAVPQAIVLVGTVASNTLTFAAEVSANSRNFAGLAVYNNDTNLAFDGAVCTMTHDSAATTFTNPSGASRGGWSSTVWNDQLAATASGSAGSVTLIIAGVEVRDAADAPPSSAKAYQTIVIGLD